MKCIIKGCINNKLAKGMCSTHYNRLKNGVDLNKEIRIFRLECTVKECKKKHHSNGLCSMHLRRKNTSGSIDSTKYNRSMPTGYYKSMPEYAVWQEMKQRCYNPNNPGYKWWGGRGIKVCDEWTEKPNGFVNFINHIGRRPNKSLSIDRIDNNGDYEPNNVRWTDSLTQRINQRPRKSKI